MSTSSSSVEHYFQFAITPNATRGQYTPPVWRVICKTENLASRVVQMEKDENVTVTKVINEDTGKAVPEKMWRA